MKTLRTIAGILFFSLIAYGMTSCMIRAYDDGNGRHRGRGHRIENNELDREGVIIIQEKKGHHKKEKHGH